MKERLNILLRRSNSDKFFFNYITDNDEDICNESSEE